MKIHPIRSEESYEKAMDRAATLMGATDKASMDELDVLQAMIERWERTRYPIAAADPVEAIKFRMAQARLKPRDLIPLIGSRSRVSEVLSGARPLSLDMIRALNKHLGIPAAALIGSAAPNAPERTAPPSRAAIDKLRSLGFIKARETVEAFLARAFGSATTGAMLRKTRTERTNAKTDFAAVEAWCAAVTLKASRVDVPPLAKKAVLRKAGRELATLSSRPNGLLLVRDRLAELGIIFVVLEHLPGTYLDGAAMCRSDGAPIIALTLRHDRIDNFWFTLLHEFCHVAKHLKPGRSVILDDLELRGEHDIEVEADSFAQDSLLPPKIASSLKDRDLSWEDVTGLAQQAKVHPAVIAGRWQKENNEYRRFSKMLGRGEVRALLNQ